MASLSPCSALSTLQLWVCPTSPWLVGSPFVASLGWFAPLVIPTTNSTAVAPILLSRGCSNPNVGFAATTSAMACSHHSNPLCPTLPMLLRIYTTVAPPNLALSVPLVRLPLCGPF